MKASTILADWINEFIIEHGTDEMRQVWDWDARNDFIKLAEKNMKEKKEKKEKKPKDKDAPKGARTAYILYCMEERPKIKEEFPEIKNQEIVKEMAKRWNQLKDDEDAFEYYRKLAEEDKERAVQEKGEYVPNEEPVVPKKKTKRTKTGYQLFCDEERASVKEDGFVGREVMVELGRRWKALPEEDEDRWQQYMENAQLIKKKIPDEEEDEEEEKPKKTKKTKKSKKVEEDEEEEEEEKPKKKKTKKRLARIVDSEDESDRE